MEKLNQMVEHAQTDYETGNDEALRIFGDMVARSQRDLDTQNEEATHGTATVFEANPLPAGATWKLPSPRDLTEQIFRPQVPNPQAAPVFYGNSSFVLPADGTWKVMHHPGPYLNWNLPRPVEEGSSDEESGESATSSDSDEMNT